MSGTIQRFALAQTLAHRRAGVGGLTWHVRRSSGDGVTAPRNDLDAGTVSGYVRRSKKVVQSSAAPGTPIQVEVWLFESAHDQDVRIGDTLVDAADSALTFEVTTHELTPRGLVCELTPGAVL